MKSRRVSERRDSALLCLSSNLIQKALDRDANRKDRNRLWPKVAQASSVERNSRWRLGSPETGLVVLGPGVYHSQLTRGGTGGKGPETGRL